MKTQHEEAPVPEPARGHDVFVSYSRADRDAVVGLTEGLATRGKRAWVDLEDIPPSAEWMAEIKGAIDAADGYLVVVSPDLAASKVCAQELDHASQSGKRVVPVLVRPTDSASVPEGLAALNWIDATEGLDLALDRVVSALETDLGHVRAHSRLLVRAREWQARGSDRSLLLRGSDLAEAEAFLVQGQGKEPVPTTDQARFVAASRQASSRRQRTVIGAIAVALVIALVLSVIAVIQRGEAIDQREAAERQAAISTSRELAAASTAQLSVDPELSLLLAIESAEAAPTTQSADALRDALIASRHVGTLVGHENPILDASFSDDGARVLTTSSFQKGYVPGGDQGDHSVRVWDTATGEQVAEIETSGSSVPIAEFAPGGSSVLIADDQSPAMWDASSGASLRSYEALDPGAADLSPTGAEVAGVCGERLCVVDAASGDVVARVGLTSVVHDVTYAPDGRSVVAASERDAFVADPATGDVVRILAPFDIGWMSVSAGGSRLLLANEDEVGVWDLATGDEVGTWATNADVEQYRFPVEPAINAGGTRIATMNGGGTITVWNARSGAPVSVLPASSVPDVEFGPDGQRLLTVSEDHTATLWDAERGRAVAEFLGAPGHLWLGRFSPDGSAVVTAGSDLAAWVWVVDPGAPVEVLTAKPGGDGQTATFVPDGSGVLTGGYAGVVRLWDASGGEVVRTFTAVPETDERYVDWIWNAVASPDGSQVAASTSVQKIVLWDAGTGERTATLSYAAGEGPGAAGVISSLDGVTWAIAYSPDGAILASASQDGVARLWDPVQGKVIAQLTDHEAAVDDVAFSPDGAKLLTGSDDGTAKIWDLATREPILTLEGQPQGVTTVAWSPDGGLLATGSYDGTIHLRDAETGRTLHVLTGSLGVVQTLDFSSDSRWLASLSDEDGAFRVWDAATGRLADIHQGTLGSMGYAVDFSPDGEFIAVPGYTGPFGSGVPETLIYRCELCTGLRGLLALANERVTRDLSAEEQERFLHRSEA
jgi:WD40 repeat protein